MATVSEAELTLAAGDGRLVLPAAAGTSLRQTLLDNRVLLRTPCAGRGVCGGCRLRAGGRLSPITETERTLLGPKLLESGWRLACQARLEGAAELDCDSLAMGSGWTALGEGELRAYPAAGASAVDGDAPLGLAIDLGTTHLRVVLWDRRRGRRLGALSAANPQAGYGADVLSRLEAAAAGQAAELSAAIVQAVAAAVADLLSLAYGGANAEGIGHVVVVGNTAMLLLLTETAAASLLLPDDWQLRVPCHPADPDRLRQAWNLAATAAIEIAQPLGGFVGSDLSASVAACGLLARAEPALLIDVGTNTELALWDGSRLWVTSSPGGPAFEGVGVSCGMPAQPGAVYRLRSDTGGTGYRAEVVGDRTALGLCGSGLIDAVAALCAAGIVRPSGRFADPPPAGGYPLPVGPDDAVLSLEAADIDTLQRAKAAIAAAAQCLLEQAGLRWERLGRLYLCGVFGHHLHLDHARALGLIPGLPDDRIELHGHAALGGCGLALLEGAGRLEEIAARCRLVNAALLPGFDDRFIGHLRLRPWPASA